MKRSSKLWMCLIAVLFVSPFVLSVFTRDTVATDCYCHLDASVDGCSIGTILMWVWSSSSLPAGWFVCNSSNHALNSRIPNMQSMFLVGYNVSDSSYSSLNKTGGAKTVIITNSTMAAHTHTYQTISGSGAIAQFFNNPGRNVGGLIVGQLMGNTGGSGGVGPAADPHNNLPPYKTVYYVIKIS